MMAGRLGKISQNFFAVFFIFFRREHEKHFGEKNPRKERTCFGETNPRKERTCFGGTNPRFYRGLLSTFAPIATFLFLRRADRDNRGDGELVGALVHLMSGVTLDPMPAHVVLAERG